MLSGENYSLSDIAAATGQNDFGGNGAWWIIILFLFAFCGWGGNGYGRQEIPAGPTYDVGAGIRGIQNGLSDGFYAINTGLLNGFSGVNGNISAAAAGLQNSMCQSFNGLNTSIMAANNGIQQGLNNIHYDMATDTCAINTANANNTRDIIDSQNAGTRAILDAIETSKVEAMQEKINALQMQNQSLQFAASQSAQSNYLINTLRPTPVPAYTAPNPFPPYTGYGVAV